MLFNSVSFLVYFPIVVLLYFVMPDKIKNHWLLLASFYFYACWNPKYLFLLLIVILVTYVSGCLIAGAKKRIGQTLTLTVCVMLNLSVLFFFKYYTFALTSLCSALEKIGIAFSFPALDLILPVGISFYMFQALGYVFDVYRGDVAYEKNILRYALFVSFFPQILSGPIERYGYMRSQFETPHRFDASKAQSGLLLMLLGFMEKLVVAEMATIAVDRIFGSFREMSAIYLWIGSILFAVQIYCDFSGYSHIAIGAARVLGFDLRENFRQPYFARSIKETWKRWHVSLTGWFRDYLYIPLGGNRKGTLRKYINICMVFFVSGLWHGASWHFVFWGLLNGLYQVGEDLWDKLTKKRWKAPAWFAVLRTFLMWSVAFIFFRIPSLREGFEYVWYMFTKWNMALSQFELSVLGMEPTELVALMIGIAVLWFADYRREVGKPCGKWLCEANTAVRWSVCMILCLFIVIIAFRSFGQGAASFIYFQF